MSNVKDFIKEKLNQLSKEELVDALADVCSIYVSANITTQLSSANCIQQCVNNVQTMTAKKLKEALANVPDDAEIYKKVFESISTFVDVKKCEYNEEMNIVELT